MWTFNEMRGFVMKEIPSHLYLSACTLFSSSNRYLDVGDYDARCKDLKDRWIRSVMWRRNFLAYHHCFTLLHVESLRHRVLLLISSSTSVFYKSYKSLELCRTWLVFHAVPLVTCECLMRLTRRKWLSTLSAKGWHNVEMVDLSPMLNMFNFVQHVESDRISQLVALYNRLVNRVHAA